MRLVPVLVASVLLSACTGPYSSPTVSAKNEGKPPVVHAQRIALLSIPDVITATGELSALDTATISAKVPGRVAKLNVDFGSPVEEGQVLAELEKDDYAFRVTQSEALVNQTRARLGLSGSGPDKVVPEETSMVRQAAASLKEARLMHANSTKLAAQGVVSRVDFERAGVALQAAEARYQGSKEEVFQIQAQLMERRAQLALARQQLADTVIRAPFRGAVTKRPATLGEYLAINTPVAVIVRSHPLRLRLEVPERQAGKVRIGQRIDVKVEGSGTTRSGKVVRLSPSLETQNRSLLIEGEVPNQDNILRAGSFVEGTITVNAQAQGISIPVKAVMNFAGVERVFVAESGTLAERVVKAGRRLTEDTVQVMDGLKPGDLVVTDPSDRLAVGQKVEVSGL
ncbi:MAG: efflux RND transporter periplasmic adaptor subunit [Bryobacteraceae bacterium]